jgi:ribosomal protein uL23
MKKETQKKKAVKREAEKKPKKPELKPEVKGSAEPKKAKPKQGIWNVVIHPHLAEKSMNMIEAENKLVFIVNKETNKKAIKDVIEAEFNVKVKSVRVEITQKGQKKAYVTLKPDYSAADIASKMGML